ncbi:MAG: hypothetical protein C0154_14190 [Mucilaginibacter sp.]|nr:MAG: hypothetical protein BGO48_12540 [Mucilaginibacter sp. 44-25]PLW88928.1 MAG: hypothetical protein C0154_14190 [Mucilaginibacter sp.]HEK22183.1 nucleotidyltransferase domain-containing protein [Bacteroidota bacterium]
MQYGLSENTVFKIIEVLKQFPAIEKAVLYGSRAKGTYKPHSDIDITLSGEELNLAQLSHIVTMLDDLLLPYQFDVSIYHQIDNVELLDHIKRVGIQLFSSSR